MNARFAAVLIVFACHDAERAGAPPHASEQQRRSVGVPTASSAALASPAQSTPVSALKMAIALGELKITMVGNDGDSGGDVDVDTTPIIVVRAGGALLLDGAPIETVVTEDGPPRRIESLEAALEARRRGSSAMRDRRVSTGGVVLLDIEQTVPAILVKRVFQTCAYAGYPRVGFLVRAGDAGAR